MSVVPRYWHQLTPCTLPHATGLPAAGSWLVSETELVHRGAGGRQGKAWVVVAQVGRGINKQCQAKSHQLVGALQGLQLRLAPAFVLAYQGDNREAELGLGSHVVLDAVQCGHGRHSLGGQCVDQSSGREGTCAALSRPMLSTGVKGTREPTCRIGRAQGQRLRCPVVIKCTMTPE